MTSLRSVRGSAVLITGAASGIGLATAQLFASEGAHVALCDVNEEGARAAAAEIVAAGGSARAWVLDVADGDQIIRVVDEAAAAFGRLDILVNNAGIARFVDFDDAQYDALWSQVIAVNLTAHPRIVRAALPYLKTATAARVINIASTEAIRATRRNTNYAAAKAAVLGLTRGMAVDLGPLDITVNAICPGPIETAMTAAVTPERRVQFATQMTALERWGNPSEIAHMILSLALPAASFTTGAVLVVDGGLTARN